MTIALVVIGTLIAGTLIYLATLDGKIAVRRSLTMNVARLAVLRTSGAGPE